jgi:hypothetical protein
MSKSDFEELYGNRSKYGIVVSFASRLMHEAIKQIGLNELRRQLHLKPQTINFTEVIREEFDKSEFESKALEYFQEKARLFNRAIL